MLQLRMIIHENRDFSIFFLLLYFSINFSDSEYSLCPRGAGDNSQSSVRHVKSQARQRACTAHTGEAATDRSLGLAAQAV